MVPIEMSACFPLRHLYIPESSYLASFLAQCGRRQTNKRSDWNRLPNAHACSHTSGAAGGSLAVDNITDPNVITLSIR